MLRRLPSTELLLSTTRWACKHPVRISPKKGSSAHGRTASGHRQDGLGHRETLPVLFLEELNRLRPVREEWDPDQLPERIWDDAED